jgi:hypothetical protein
VSTEIIAWYSQGALTGARLQDAIDEAMSTMAVDDVEISQLGLDEADLRTARFTVKEEGGFVAEGILLAIAIGAGGNITADVAKALWNKVLKRVKEERGADAVGPEQRDRKTGSESG